VIGDDPAAKGYILELSEVLKIGLKSFLEKMRHFSFQNWDLLEFLVDSSL
jgi:hypothetical protein